MKKQIEDFQNDPTNDNLALLIKAAIAYQTNSPVAKKKQEIMNKIWIAKDFLPDNLKPFAEQVHYVLESLKGSNHNLTVTKHGDQKWLLKTQTGELSILSLDKQGWFLVPSVPEESIPEQIFDWFASMPQEWRTFS
jgi:hypothetical protein